MNAEIQSSENRKNLGEKLNWPSRVTDYFRLVDMQVEFGDGNVFEQMGDKLQMMSGSLVFGHITDVNFFEGFENSIRRWTSGLPMRHGLKDDGVILGNEIFDMISNNQVSSRVVVGWFDAISGIMCSPHHNRFLSVSLYYDPVATLSELYSDEPENVSNDSARPVHSSLGRLRDLADGVADCLEINKDQVTGVNLTSLLEVVGSAKRLSKFIKLLENSGALPGGKDRKPTPFHKIIIQTSTAIADRFLSAKNNTESVDVDRIVSEICSLLRVNQVSIDETGIMGLCSSLRKRGDLDFEEHSSIWSYAGLGIDILPYLYQLTPKKTKEIEEFISDKVVPNFILQLRMLGYQHFKWEHFHYKLLGLDETIWNKHKKVLDSNSLPPFPDLNIIDDPNGKGYRVEVNNKALTEYARGVSARSAVKKGDVVFLITGTFNKFTYTHLHALWQSINIEKCFLGKAGIVDSDFSGDVHVAVEVNNNPQKPFSSMLYIVRWLDVITSTHGLRGNFYILPYIIKDGMYTQQHSGHTAMRIAAERDFLGANGAEPLVVGRVCGTEKLGKDMLYDSTTEPYGYMQLNAMPHILFADNLINDWPSLPEKLRLIFNKFDRVIITLPPSNYHGTDIRPVVEEDPFGQHLVHPRVVIQTRH